MNRIMLLASNEAANIPPALPAMLRDSANVEGHLRRYDGNGSIKTDHTAERSVISPRESDDEIIAAPAFDDPALTATARAVTGGIFFGAKRFMITSGSLKRRITSARIKPVIISAVR